MILKFIRDYSRNGEVVACIVAVGRGKVGVSYCHPNDRVQSVVIHDGKERKVLHPFNKLDGITKASIRADKGEAVKVPNHQINPYKGGYSIRKFKLREVIAVECDKMHMRSIKFYKDLTI